MASWWIDIDGVSRRIGEDVKAYFITIIELDFLPSEEKEYLKHFDTFAPNLNRSSPKENASKKLFKKAIAKETGLRNARVYRLLIMLIFDLKWSRFFGIFEETTASKVVNWGDHGSDYGATQFFYSTKPDSHLPCYADRYIMAIYMVSRSSKLRYLVAVPMWETLFNKHPDGRLGKYIVYTDYPALQWEVECLLTLLGLKFCALRAGKLN